MWVGLRTLNSVRHTIAPHYNVERNLQKVAPDVAPETFKASRYLAKSLESLAPRPDSNQRPSG